jgi:hypothetical protein
MPMSTGSRSSEIRALVSNRSIEFPLGALVLVRSRSKLARLDDPGPVSGGEAERQRRV